MSRSKLSQWLIAIPVVCLITVNDLSLETGPTDSSQQAEYDRRSDDGQFSEEAASSGLQLASTNIDFGIVYEASTLQHTLVLTNTANAPIEIVDVSTSCGCTTVSTPTPVTLPPGGEATIPIELSTANVTGPLEKQVTVFTHEDSGRFKFPVTLRAVSLPLVDVSHRQIDLGMVSGRESATREIVVSLYHEHASRADQNSVSIVTLPGGIRANVNEVIPPRDAVRQWKVSVSVDGADIPEESIDGDLILTTPSTVESIIRIPVTARQMSFLKCSTAKLNFGAIRGDTGSQRTLSLTCQDDHTCEIKSTQIMDGPEFLVAKYHPRNQSVLIEISKAKSVTGFFSARLVVRYACDGGSRQSLVIPITGYRLAAATPDRSESPREASP